VFRTNPASAQTGGVTYYAEDAGAWLHDEFRYTPQDLEHNQAHPNWLSIEGKSPVFTVDVVMAPADAITEGNAYQVTLPSSKEAESVSAIGQAVTRENRDPNLTQHPHALEVTFDQNDYMKQFPKGASPAMGLIIVQKVNSKKASAPRHRRALFDTFARVLRPTPSSAGIAALVVLAFSALADDGATVPQSNLLIEIVTYVLGVVLLIMTINGIRLFVAYVNYRFKSLDAKLLYKANVPPEQSLRAPEPPLTEKVPTPKTILRPSANDEDFLSLEDQKLLSTYLAKLFPDAVTIAWEIGKEWWTNHRLTFFQRLLWPLGWLRIKRTFNVRRHRLLYRSYKRMEVGLAQSFLIYYKNRIFSPKVKGPMEGKFMHYSLILGTFIVIYAVLYIRAPFLLNYIPTTIKLATPTVQFLQGIQDPQIEFWVNFFINLMVFSLMWTLLKPVGEGAPIYFWLMTGLASLPPGYVAERNAETKTDQPVKKILQLTNADVLSQEEAEKAIDLLDSDAREVQSGLAYMFDQVSPDIQEYVSESFFEFDRDLRFNRYATRLDSLRLDFMPDSQEDSLDAKKLADRRRTHAIAVRTRLTNPAYARGILFAIAANDLIDLALEGLDSSRAKAIRPALEQLTDSMPTLIVGLNQVSGKNRRDHDLFRWIHTIMNKFTLEASSELNILHNQFISFANGDTELTSKVESLFSHDTLTQFQRRHIIYDFVMRWSKTDPVGLRKAMTISMQQLSPSQLAPSIYLNDKYLGNGSDPNGSISAARLLMAQHHGEELAESMSELGIPIFPRQNPRSVLLATDVFSNLQQAVRFLKSLTSLIRGRAIAASASDTTNPTTTQLLSRIPRRLPFSIGWRIRALYASELDADAFPKVKPGREPVAIFTTSAANQNKFMHLHHSIRVLIPAAHLAELGLYETAASFEKEWLNTAFNALEQNRDLSPIQKEQLAWARTNFLTVRDWLASIGIGSSYDSVAIDTKRTDMIMSWGPDTMQAVSKQAVEPVSQRAFGLIKGKKSVGPHFQLAHALAGAG